MRRPILARATVAGVLFALDLLLAALWWPAAVSFASQSVTFFPMLPIDPFWLVSPVSELAMLWAMGLYRRDALVGNLLSSRRLPLIAGMAAVASVCASVGFAAAAPGVFALSRVRDDVLVLALAVAWCVGCGVLARLAMGVLLLRRWPRRQLLVIGAGARAWDLLRMLAKEGTGLHYDIAFLHDPALGEIDPRLAADPDGRILLVDRFHVLAAARHVNAEQIVVAPDERRGMDLEQLLLCKKAGFPLVQYLAFVEREIGRIDIKRLDLGWLVFSDGFSFGVLDRASKRLFDIAVSGIVLILTAPLIVAGIAAIRWEGAGPVFYRQDRVTLDGRVFRILKLRTMRVDAEASGAVWAAEKDNRITRAGRFLRRTRIDELPQLLNILKGEMSFVGPRPERPMFVEELAAQIPLYRERHMVKAGLTGWAQINYPYGASVDDARSKLSYDLYYVKNFSILFDFRILAQTLRVVLWPGGVR